MRLVRWLAGSTLALLLTSFGFAQSSVWTVDDDGPADFADIQSAIDASSDGDTILVGPGLYAGFDINARGVTIIGQPGGTSVNTGVSIEFTAASQVVVLSGMSIDNLEDEDRRPLRAYGALGPIRVQSCDIEAHHWSGYDEWGYAEVSVLPGAYVYGCADVCLVDCSMSGADGVTGYDLAGGFTTPGATGLSVRNSVVSLYDCNVQGGEGAYTDDDVTAAGDGASGVETRVSTLFASNTVFTGGKGGDIAVDPWGWWVVAGTGGSGFDFQDQPSVLRLLDCTIIPGVGGCNVVYGGDCAADGVDFHRAGSATILQLPGTHRKMELSALLQSGGADVLATFHGEPGDQVYLPTDWDTALTFDASVKGTWILPQPVTIPPQPIAVIPAAGMIEVPIPFSAPTGGNAAEVEYRQMYVVDGVGNRILGSPAATLQVDCAQPTSYCVGAPNSLGSGSLISLSGSVSISGNDAVLHATGASANEFGLFYYGRTSVQLPWGDGYRCVGGGVYRLGVVTSDGVGSASDPLDYLAPPMNAGSGMITIASTWNFQYWYRDPSGPVGTGFNASDALAVTFCP